MSSLIPSLFGGLSLINNSSRTGTVIVQQTTQTETRTTVQKQLRHYVLLFDLSGSMAGGKIRAMVEQFKEFRKSVLKKKDYISVISFTNNVRVLADSLQVDQVDFRNLVAQISVASGGTALYDAILKGIEVARSFSRSKKDVVTELVAFTDGQDQHSSTALIDVKSKVAKPGVANFNMIVLVVGTSGIPAMQAICSEPQHAHLISEDDCNAEAIRKVFGKMTKIMKKKVTTVTTQAFTVSAPAISAMRVPSKRRSLARLTGGGVPANRCRTSLKTALKKTCIAPECGNKVGANYDLCKTCNKRLRGPTSRSTRRSTPRTGKSTPRQRPHYLMQATPVKQTCLTAYCRNKVGQGYSLCQHCNASGPTFGAPF